MEKEIKKTEKRLKMEKEIETNVEKIEERLKDAGMSDSVARVTAVIKSNGRLKRLAEE